MKNILLLVISLGYCASVYAQKEPASDTLYQTPYFSFHNNMWMNLHHFFYEQASNQQKHKLAEDSLRFRDIGDSARIAELSTEERNIFDAGVAFYRQNIIDQQLLHSGKIFKWLQAHPTNQRITDTTYSKKFTTALNRLKSLYEAHFWPRHQKENDALLREYIELIQKTETTVIGKMEGLSGSTWKTKVRVDLTTYGNWAGAYSPDLDNIVISSIDPQMNSTIFIEFVFHESSHLLFLRKSPFRMAIFKQAKTLEIKQPRHLWHAAMFYLSGIATQEALKEHGISHVLIMEKKNVFERYYHNGSFKATLRTYYNREIDLDEMADRLLKPN